MWYEVVWHEGGEEFFGKFRLAQAGDARRGTRREPRQSGFSLASIEELEKA